MNEKINLRQLAERLPEEFFGSDTENRVAIVNELFSLVSEAMAEGEAALLPGFGIFEPGGNSSDPVVFKADKAFNEIVNAPFASFGPVDLDPEVTDNMLEAVAESSTDTSDSAAADATEPENEGQLLPQDQSVGTTLQSEPETASVEVVEDAKAISEPEEKSTFEATEIDNDLQEAPEADSQVEELIDMERGGETPEISEPLPTTEFVPQSQDQDGVTVEMEEVSSRFGIGYFWDF